MTTHAEQRDARRNRAEKMAEMYRQGLTLADIGRQYEISRERVRQLLRLIGVTAQDGGRVARVKAVKSATISKQRQREAKQEARFGVPYDLLRELRAIKATLAYQTQKTNSRNRGIEFDLTLAEWWAVWQASGKFHLRGVGVGRYCMSRIRDTGGYALGNVHVQLSTENSRDAVEKWRGKEKSIRGVFCLYPGRELAWFAKVGKVGLGFHRTAEEAGAARDEWMRVNGMTGGSVQNGLGAGRGWTFVKRLKSRPYCVQVQGTKSTFHATQEEAEAEYKRRCAEVAAKRATPGLIATEGAPAVPAAQEG